MKKQKLNSATSAILLSAIIGAMFLLGIFAERNYIVVLSLFSFACVYAVLGYAMKKNFSLAVLIIFALVITVQMVYFMYLENRFSPVPILIGIILINHAIQDYKSFIKDNRTTQKIGDQ